LQEPSARPDERPSLYRRLLYAPELEREALERLARRDTAGCRRVLLQLLEGLELENGSASHREAVGLLLDVLQRVNRRLHPSGDDVGQYETHRASLIEEFASCESGDGARARFTASLNRLLGLSKGRGRSAHHLVERAKEYIEDGYQRRISLSAVAEALHISPNYLSRVFRRETGITLTAYIQRVRLQAAVRMLGDGRHTIAEIAYRVGYQNYRDFYRNFVKYEKASPRQVQRRLARNDS
jgi:AraC-like DNA-binding protein